MQTNVFFDVIVIGVGSMGASACYYLSAGGAKVLGIEQFDITHNKGSHSGQSRLIRKAYFEHPDYVPLLQRAYGNWKHLETIAGEQVFYKTGLLYSGPKNHLLMKGIHMSADKYRIPLEEVTHSKMALSFPALNVPPNNDCLFEPDAGFITPEKSIRLYAEKAEERGAVILKNTMVYSWREEKNEIKVHTDAGIFRSAKLIIAAGAWASKIVPTLNVPLHVTKQVLAWVHPANSNAVELGRFPCWMVVDNDWPGVFYGFPMLPADQFGTPVGFKLALHYPGALCNPNEDNRLPSEADELKLINFLEKYFPGLYVSTNQLKTCLYTYSPDEHFIVDYLPEYEGRVAVAAGFSGHGFKFVSVVGELLSEMMLKGGTDLYIGFLQLKRFG